jgi:hypothetical protein
LIIIIVYRRDDDEDCKIAVNSASLSSLKSSGTCMEGRYTWGEGRRGGDVLLAVVTAARAVAKSDCASSRSPAAVTDRSLDGNEGFRIILSNACELQMPGPVVVVLVVVTAEAVAALWRASNLPLRTAASRAATTWLERVAARGMRGNNVDDTEGKLALAYGAPINNDGGIGGEGLSPSRTL